MDSNLVARFEALTKRREEVKQELSRTEGKLQEVKSSLEKLVKDLEETYGTSDVALLEKKMLESHEKIAVVIKDVESELSKIESINNVS